MGLVRKMGFIPTRRTSIRLVRKVGLSLQKPMRRANRRDEEAIERWKEERWPSLKKGP